MTTKPRGKELTAGPGPSTVLTLSTLTSTNDSLERTATRNKSGRGELPREIIRFGTAIFPALPKVITNTVIMLTCADSDVNMH